MGDIGRELASPPHQPRRVPRRTAPPKTRSSRGSWLLTALVVAVGLGAATAAAAAPRVVVRSFRGPHGATAAGVVRRALSGVRVVSGGPGVSAVVKGEISRLRGRWVLRVRVISQHNKRTVGRRTFIMRGSRLDRRTASRAARTIARLARRTRPAARPTRRRRRRRRRRRPKPRPVQPKPQPKPQPQPRVVQPQPQPRVVQPQPQPRVVQPQPRPRANPFDDGSDIDRDDPKLPRLADRGRGDDGGGVTGFRTGTSEGTLRGRQDDDDNDRPRRRRKRRKSSSRPSWNSVIEASVGLVVMSRSFDFNDPVGHQPNNYRSGPAAAILAEGELYPLAAFVNNPAAGLGIVARYYRVIGLKSQVSQNEPPVDTVAQTFEIGARFRWNILSSNTSPILRIGAEYGRQMFFIIQESPPLPNITYDYLKLALAGIDWAFAAGRRWRFGLMASFDYLLVFSAGDIENEDSSGYGPSNTGAISFSGGLFGNYAGFFVKAGAFYRRYFFNFDRACAVENRCNEAGGALDVYLGGMFNLGYAY